MKVNITFSILVAAFALLNSLDLSAQKGDRLVTRCIFTDYEPVFNIFVDAENNKWVATPKKILQVKASNYADPLPLSIGEQSAFGFRGGNADKRWSTEAINALLKTEIDVSAAFYDAKNDILWIGTSGSGLFGFKTEPQLAVFDKMSTANSKLKSNDITDIFIDKTGKYWICTPSGLMTGTPGKWKAELDFYDVRRVREQGGSVYVLADDGMLTLEGSKWKTYAINEKAVEGEAVDFDIDPDGKFWILSGVVAKYDLFEETVQTYSGPEYYTSEFGKCITADPDGTIWVGTEDKGLYVFEKTSNLTVNAVVEKELSCTGNGQDANLKVKIVGGKAPYTFQWSVASLQGETPKNVATGTYVITVTEAGGKTKVAKVVVADPRPKITAQQKAAESGAGKSDGIAEVKTDEGANYTYKWSNGATTAVANKLVEGDYNVTVTSQKGCNTIATVNITQKTTSLLAAIESVTPISCAGGAVALKAVVSGGKMPYRYQWSNPALVGEQTASTAAGKYQLTVTDALGTAFSAGYELKQPEPITVSILVQASSSPGKSDGKAMATVKGGAGKYAFVWDNQETSSSPVRLNTGQHMVTVTDASGCAVTASVAITENLLPLAAIIEEASSIKCAGSNAGLRVKVSGGKSPYQYQWNIGALVGETPSNVPSGNYQLTVTDGTGGKTTAAFFVKQPEAMSATIQVQKAASTGNADGRATLQGKGGVGNYTYQWDSGETLANATKLSPGKHLATITDANGCTAQAEATISENLLPLSASIQEIGNIACNGGQGSLRVEVSGGKSPYQFQWSSPNLKGDQLTSVSAGDYQLTITDAVGGKFATAIKIKQPEAFIATILAQSPASTGKSDGKASLQIKGGTGPFIYVWDTGETGLSSLKLSPGKHTATITDANRCTTQAEIEIFENILPLAVTVQEITKIKCAGGTQGSLQVSITGGKTPYQLQLNGANTETAGNETATFNSLTFGDYQITVIDAVKTKYTTSISIKQPDPVTVTALTQNPASTGKSDGKANGQAKGGTGAYIYAWDSGETSASASQLAPGKHALTVTDANGCQGIGSVEITENILPLAATILEINKIKCAGSDGSLQVNISGGKAPFQYQWSNPSLLGDKPTAVKAGDYQLTITDVVGNKFTATTSLKQPEAIAVTVSLQTPASTGKSDGKANGQAKGGTGAYVYVWDNGENTVTASKLAPGKHTLTVTDANACQGTGTVEVNENILPLTATIQETYKIKCAGGDGSLFVSVSGGKGPFLYLWSQSTLQGDQPRTVKAGEYQLTITDAVNNKFTANISIKQPDAVVATVLVQASASTGKSDGKALAQPKGGTGSYSYAWDNAEATATASKLAPGKHTLTVTDANACLGTGSFEITENILPLAAVIQETNKIKCAGGDGGLQANISGGKAPFQYQWSNPALQGDQPNAVRAGDYQLTVTDAIGTKVSTIFSSKQPEAITVSIQAVAPASTGNSDGKANGLAKGGIGAYVYAWDNGETTASAAKLAPAKHTLTVTDANGCKGTATIEITENILPLAVTIQETGKIKCTDGSSALKVTVSGGKAPFTYQWNSAQIQGDQPTAVKAGDYQLTITDVAKNQFTANISVKQPETLTVEVQGNLGATTERSKDGRATLKVKGGVAPYVYAWDNAEAAALAKQLTLGNHNATVTDANGCATTVNIKTDKRILPALTASALSNGQTIGVEQLQFDADSTKMNDKSLPVLNEMYNFLQENGGIVIEVGGHTNNIPPDAFCDKLSTARAKSVADYLTAKGIDPNRVFFKGYGKRKPIVSNDTPEGRKQNQRVEIKILQMR